MADMSRYAVNNIAGIGGGVSINKSFSDVIDIPPEEKRTAEEIINSIASRLNGVTNVQSI